MIEYSTVTLLAGLLALAGAMLALSVLRRLRHGRLLAAGAASVGGCGLLALAGLIALTGLNLHTYQRLTHEQSVAVIEFQQLGTRHYLVRLYEPASEQPRLFELRGDEWQLDARLLKWHPAVNLLGLDASYRLERLSGRYRDIERERQAPRSVYALAAQPGMDLWRLAREHPRWLPWVDAYYGSATYLPMAGGARFQISVGQNGLIARPLNRVGHTAVDGWR